MPLDMELSQVSKKDPTPDQWADLSAVVLTDMIRERQPFFFIRYGDGALECMAGRIGCTCDLEPYSNALGDALLNAWLSVVSGSHTFVGDWQSASFEDHDQSARYVYQYAHLCSDAPLKFLHFEALLLMRESAAVVDFYRAVKEDRRRKLYMGPRECADAAKMLGAEHLVVPMTDLFSHVAEIENKLVAADFEVLLYGAGMAGNIPAVKCWERFPERTYVNLGSAMDILFRGRSRRQQLAPERARYLFRELL